jgi:hypothetical protein
MACRVRLAEILDQIYLITILQGKFPPFHGSNISPQLLNILKCAKLNIVQPINKERQPWPIKS